MIISAHLSNLTACLTPGGTTDMEIRNTFGLEVNRVSFLNTIRANVESTAIVSILLRNATATPISKNCTLIEVIESVNL